MKLTDEQGFFDYIKTMRLLASKDLGQNFLINPNIARKIVDYLEIRKGEKVLEIGAGFGSLSYFLVEHDSEIVLLDVDPKTITFLSENFVSKQLVNIIQESILKHDVSTYEKIIGNLPYYITSDTIEYVLLKARKTRKMVLMIQKEVLPRLLAKVGEEGYGPLAILTKYLGSAQKVLNVSRGQFVPAPHVDSIVVVIDINENNDYETAEKLLKITMKLFHHRRKTIRNNLRLLLGDDKTTQQALLSAGIDGDKRPQDISQEDYLRLTKQLKF